MVFDCFFKIHVHIRIKKGAHSTSAILLSSPPRVFIYGCDCLQSIYRMSKTNETEATLNTVKSLDQENHNVVVKFKKCHRAKITEVHP